MTSSNGHIFRITGHWTGEFPAQRPVTRPYHVFFDLRLNKPFCKQSWAWWFETLSPHHDVIVMLGNCPQAWSRQATNHYKNHGWPSSMSSYGVSRGRWVKRVCLTLTYIIIWLYVCKLDRVNWSSIKYWWTWLNIFKTQHQNYTPYLNCNSDALCSRLWCKQTYCIASLIWLKGLATRIWRKQIHEQYANSLWKIMICVLYTLFLLSF